MSSISEFVKYCSLLLDTNVSREVYIVTSMVK